MGDLKDLPVRRRQVSVGVVKGRLQLGVAQFDSQMLSSVSSDDWHGKLSTRFAQQGELTVDYTLTKGNRSVSYLVNNYRDFLVTDSGNQESAPAEDALEFRQAISGPLVITLKSAEGPAQKRSYESFWQLALVEPQLLEQRIWPLLYQLNLNNRVKAFPPAIQSKLLEFAKQSVDQDVRDWEHAVARLGSPRYAERKKAERELVRAGAPVVLFLRSLNDSQLDSEQRERIDSIEQLLSPQYSDDASEAALGFLSDARVWTRLALQAKPDSDELQLALRTLDRIRPDGKSPPTDRTSPKVREYLEGIRQHLELRSAQAPGKSDES